MGVVSCRLKGTYGVNSIIKSKTDTMRTSFSQFWNNLPRSSNCKWLSVFVWRVFKQVTTLLHANISFQPLSRSKCWKEDRQKDKKLVKSPLTQCIGLIFLFRRLRLAPMMTVIGIIFLSYRLEKPFSESVSYSCAYVRTSATATSAIQSSGDVTSVAFTPSVVAWTAPLSLLSHTGWSLS